MQDLSTRTEREREGDGQGVVDVTEDSEGWVTKWEEKRRWEESARRVGTAFCEAAGGPGGSDLEKGRTVELERILLELEINYIPMANRCQDLLKERCSKHYCSYCSIPSYSNKLGRFFPLFSFWRDDLFGAQRTCCLEGRKRLEPKWMAVDSSERGSQLSTCHS